MRTLKNRLPTLAVALAAAAMAAGAVQACGMGGEPAPTPQPAPAPPPPPSTGGYAPGGSSDGGGGGGASWDSGGADRMRQGVDSATHDAGGDDSGGRRSSGGGSSGGGAGGSADFSSQISSLGAAEAKAEPPAEPPPRDESDGHTGGTDNIWWSMLTGDTGLEHSLTDKFNADHPVVDPRVEAELDKPWYQRASEAWQAINPPGHDIPETGGGNSVWWTMLTGDNGLEHSLQPPPDTSPEGIERAEQWKAYNDLPWYQRWTTPDPDYHPPSPKPPYPPALNQPRMGRNG